MTFKEQIELYLGPLPSEWREKLTAILCLLKEDKQTPDCADFKACETVTSLSPFSIEDTTLSITYTDEDGVSVTRSVDLAELMNRQLDELTPGCLTDAETWNSLTYQERLQLIINTACSCGPPVEISYNSANTDICAGPFTEPVTFVLVGLEGQGAFAFNITLNSTTSSIQLPSGLTGDFRIMLNAEGSEYMRVRIQDSGNVDLLDGTTDGGGFYGYIFNPSTTFDIEDMDHIIFNCVNSG